MSADLLNSPLTFATILFTVVGLLLLTSGLMAIGNGRPLALSIRLLLGLAILGAGLTASVLAAGLHGYRAFNKEVVAARVSLQPIGAQKFSATVQYPDGRRQRYEVAGDEIYIDGHIIKWEPYANLLGLHTSYELDRLGGRYTQASHEKTRERTVHVLGQEKLLNLVALRNRYEVLKPLIDAEYGSATFMPVTGPAEFEVRVSTSGLLMRKV